MLLNVSAQFRHLLLDCLALWEVKHPSALSVVRPPVAFGDLATNLPLLLAKSDGGTPQEWAERLIRALAEKGALTTATVDQLPETSTYASWQGITFSALSFEKGFLNATLDPTWVVRTSRHLLEDAHPWRADLLDRTVIIEYSAPNIAKPFGIGHLRSTIIGESLARITEATGNRVVRINFPGDWGTQFGKLMVAYTKWGNREAFLSSPDAIAYLQGLYVQFHQEVEQHPELEDEARAWFKRLELGEEEPRALWKEFRDLSLTEFERIYQLLDVRFDEISGESMYAGAPAERVIDRAKQLGIVEESEGALIIRLDLPDMPKPLPPLLLQKTDGATLYDTRDLAAAIDRAERYHFDTMVYEVGAEQELRFRQIIASLKRLGYDWAENIVHVKHGLYLSSSGVKFSTRKGETVNMESVLTAAVEKAKDIIREKNPDLAGISADHLETAARMVGIGAVKFNDLIQNRETNVVFDWEKVLATKGKTGPFVQYAIARINGIFRKGAEGVVHDVASTADLSVLTSPWEIDVLKKVLFLGTVIEDAYRLWSPHFVAEYAVELANTVNVFYDALPVLTAESPVREARLALLVLAKSALVRSLDLLGIEAPEEM